MVLRALREDRASAFLALIGLVSLATIVAQAPADVHQLYRGADTAVAFVLPQLAGHSPPHTIIDLGNHNWYETWWFERATIGLPDHFFIWEIAPFILDLVGIAVVCGAVAAAFDWRAALYTGVVLLSVGNGMRQVVFEPDVRVGLLVHMGLLCLALMAVWRRAEAGRLTWRWALACAIALTVFTAPGGTDQLLMIDGVVPFVGAALVWWWRNGSREARTVAVFALAVGVGSLIGESLLTTIMVHDGISSSLNLDSFGFVQANGLATDLGNTLSAWASFADGNFFGAFVSKATILTFVLGGLSFVALFAVTRLSILSIGRWWTERIATTTPAGGGTRALFVAFWAFALFMTLASYILTSVATSANSRYLLSGWVAVAALLGALITTRHGRVVLVSGVALFSVLMIRDNINSGVPPPGASYPKTTLAQIQQYVTSEGAGIGYAAYFYSHNFTWESDFKIKVFPLWPCPLRPGLLCQRPLSSDSSWFIPRPDTRTFLITGPQPLALHAAPASFGTPLAQQTFGQFTVSVYRHDVAAQVLHY